MSRPARRPALAPAFAAARDLRALAAEHSAPPAALAIAFALAHPAVACVLFRATAPRQIAENRAALDVLAGLDDMALARLREMGG